MQHIKERQLAQVLSAVCRMGKYVYIGERTESDSPCCFKHDYRALFARQGFEELRAGTTAGQSWLLFGRHDDAASLTGVRPSA
jgi:hypothetical protein